MMIRLSALAPLCAAVMMVGSAHAAEPKSVSTKITTVTVYADRAQVTRSGGVDMSGAPGQQVAIDGLPGWIDHDSVRVTLVPKGKGKILDVSAEKTYLAKASEETVRKADAAVQELNDKLAELDDERRVIGAEIKQLEAIRAFTVQKLPRDMAMRPVKLKTFGETVDFVSERLRKARKALRDVAKKRRDLQPELNKRIKERSEMRTRASLQRTRVLVSLTGNGKATMKVTYLTPGAAWEPTADLRTVEGRNATLVQSASVVQTTGEDWSGAKLAFSTQRPAEILEVPAAKALLLGGGNGKGLGEVVNRMNSSFTKASSTYTTQNRILGKGDANWQNQLARQQVMQSRALASFRKLQKRGTTAHFVARSSRTVRANGKPVRVPISNAKFAMNAKLVAVPEVSLNAVRTAELTNTSEQSILPGNANLFVDGAFVGKTSLGFVAPGEKFSVFLGVNDRVKLERTVDRRRSKIERGRKRTELTVAFIVSAENLGKDNVSITITDRVPVSQSEDIEIDDVRYPKNASKSRDGLLKWKATLGPKQKKRWWIEYTLEYPTSLPARHRAERKRFRQMRKHRPNAPAASPAPKKQMLFDEIEALDAMF